MAGARSPVGIEIMLKGYKTYILAGVTVVGAAASYLVGDISLAQAIQLAVTAGIGATIRSGITEAAKKT